MTRIERVFALYALPMPDIPPLRAVRSSSLAAVGYDHETSRLYAEFCDGTLYEYFDVPSLVHEGLMASPSHGRYFDASIRPHYDFERLR